MPMVVPVSEMQKRGAELVNRAMETKEPIYLTRRGYKSVVILDADEYDRMAAAERQRVERALHTRDMIEQGRRDIEEGRTHRLDDVLSDLDEKWGRG